jgi:D-alanine-D-alanine ligase
VANIDRELFDLALIGITKHGDWYFTDDVVADIAGGERASLALSVQQPEVYGATRSFRPDVVFPVLHGTDGEDGSVQGLFKVCGIPVAGSGVLGSAVSMDKVVTKKILEKSAIPVARFFEFGMESKSTLSYQSMKEGLGLPFMVKSATLGSSVGISKVKKEEDFAPAVEEAFRYDRRILIEEFIEGRELECAILGNADAKASVPGEIVMLKDYDFYTYTAKYLDEAAIRIDIPAKIPTPVTEEIKRLCVQAFQALQCEDFARVDLFLTQDGRVVINEINTIPGFTDASMFPMLWKHQGETYRGIITKIIDLALSRHLATKDIETSFSAG